MLQEEVCLSDGITMPAKVIQANDDASSACPSDAIRRGAIDKAGAFRGLEVGMLQTVRMCDSVVVGTVDVSPVYESHLGPSGVLAEHVAHDHAEQSDKILAIHDVTRP